MRWYRFNKWVGWHLYSDNLDQDNKADCLVLKPGTFCYSVRKVIEMTSSICNYTQNKYYLKAPLHKNGIYYKSTNFFNVSKTAAC